MNGTSGLNISVVKPVNRAIERTKLILFKPFDIGKWFVMGFCAWLACLNQGGFNFHFNLPSNRQNGCEPVAGKIEDFFRTNPQLAIAIVAAVVILGILIFLLTLWLSSRGRFMFVDCVAKNKAEVKRPWTEFRSEANSLFKFNLVLSIVGIVFVLLIGAAIFGVVYLFKDYHSARWVIISSVVFAAMMVFAGMVLLGLTAKFTKDFVVPIMYIDRRKCLVGWKTFWPLLTGNTGKFALYTLFQLLVSVCIFIVVIAAVCVSCCCLGCLFAIPYIGTVAMLPIPCFVRSYSLYYLGQYGSQFDVFSYALPQEHGNY